MKFSKFLFSLPLCLFLLNSAATASFLVLEGIGYKEGDAYETDRCKLDIRRPETGKNLPVFVWFHGGGLTGGNKYFPQELQNEALVQVSVNYRLSPKVTVEDCIDDAAASVAWVFQHIENYGGDPDKIIVAGHSAGGYLASMIGLDERWLSAYGQDPARIWALFPFSGHTITHFTARKEMGIPGTRPLVDSLAPLTYVRADAPPLYLMTGDRELELLGRYEENAYMWRMMKVVGHSEVYLFEFDGHDHGAMVAPGMHIVRSFLKEQSDNP